MAIIFGKLLKKNYTNEVGTFHIYWFRAHGGKCNNAIYYGDENIPKPLKTVELQITGEWENHEKYGKRLIIKDWKRAENRTTEDHNQTKLLRDAVKAQG